MRLLDWILVALLAAAVFFAVRALIRQRGRGGCAGSGGCGGCTRCAEGRENEPDRQSDFR